MFTGLIEDLGKLRTLQRNGLQCQVTIETGLPTDSIKLGDSIAVNGCCLTVVKLGSHYFTADVSAETLERTGLGMLKAGDGVNLERALCLGDRLGGHIVTGHIDARARLMSRLTSGNAEVLKFQMEHESLRYLVTKGSVAIDGISLTVNEVTADGFSVTIIPHTLGQTTLAGIASGAVVNIETDIVGKYIERLLAPRDPASDAGSVSLEFLAKHGFV